MQKTLPWHTAETVESIARTVRIIIQSRCIVLAGTWRWDLQTNAIYCSDVMSFPPDFEGTSGIIHPDDVNNVKSALGFLQDSEPLSLEFRIITTYGHVKTIEGHHLVIQETPVNDVRFQPERTLFDDEVRRIVARKEAGFSFHRLKLMEISEKLHHIGCSYFNNSTGEIWYSDNFFKLHGLSPQSLNPHVHTFYEFIHPDDKEDVVETFERAFMQQIPVQLEYRIVLPRGGVRYVAYACNFFSNVKGQLIFAGTIRDITEDIQSEERQTELVLQTTLSRTILNFAESENSWGYWIANLATRSTNYSDSCLSIYGLKSAIRPNSFLLFNMVHPDDKERMQQLMDEMYRKHSVPETVFRIVRSDGKTRYLRQTGKVYIHGEVKLYMIVVVQDITATEVLERKLSEVASQVELGNLLKGLIEESTHSGCVTWLRDGSIKWSNGIYRLLGYKPNSIEPIHRLLEKAVHPQDLQVFREAVTLVQNQQEHDDITVRIVSRAGMRQIKMSFRQLTSPGDEGAISVLKDVTDERGISTALESSKTFVEALQDTTNDMVIFTDASNVIINWNRTAEAKTGIKTDDALNRNLFDVLEGLNNEKYLAEVQAALDGTPIHVSAVRKVYLTQTHNYRLQPLKTSDNHFIGLLHVVQDVSRELELQQRLTERLNFIQHLTEASIDRIVVLDSNMNYLYWNWRSEEYYGISRDRILGKNILEIFPTFRNDPSYNEFRRVLKGETVHLKATLNPDTNEYFETWLTPIKDDKNVYAVLWVVHDLSKELHLQEEHRKARLILDTIRDACYEVDFKGTITFVNRKAEELFGKSHEETMGHHIWDVLQEPKDSKIYQAIQLIALENKRYAQFEYKSDFLNKWIYLTATPTENGCIVLFHDIGDIVDARIELQDEHRRMIEAQTIGHIGSFEWDVINDKIYWSDELYRIHALEPQSEVITVDRFRSFFQPENREEIKSIFENARLQPTSIRIVHAVKRADGEVRTVASKWHSYADADGNINHISGTVQDITEQVEADLKLRESLTLLRTTEEAGLTGSYEANLMTGECHFSDGLFRIFGEQPGRFQPTLEYMDSITHPDDRSQVSRTLEEAIDERTSYGYTSRINLPGGLIKCIEVHGKVKCDEFQNPVKLVALIQDITERKQAELELERKNEELQKRNEQISSFAFVASHDLREPIRKILSFTDFLLDREGQHLTDQGKSYLTRITKAVNKLDLLISDILALTQIHTIKAEKSPVDLNEVFETVRKEFDHVIESRAAEVRSENLPFVEGVRQQLLLLFQNMLSNAFKFQRKENIPCISITHSLVNSADIKNRNLPKSTYHKISFIDNGIGFPNQYSQMVFGIFQKLNAGEFAEGTGIGLAICRKVMENHEGFILVDSQEGRGSVFCCYFPAR